MKYLSSLTEERLRGTFVVLRADLNVPIEENRVTDNFRIRRVVRTLRFLKERGARTIVLSHRGRSGETLAPISHELQSWIPHMFIPALFGDAISMARGAMKDGDVLLLENVRAYPEEESNDTSFAKRLAEYGSLFVNDAFSVSHRAHASVVGIAQHLPSCAGLLFEEEFTRLSAALTPQSPSLAILGGAKLETKAPLVEKLLAIYDHVWIVGALANDFIKAQGFEVGVSLVSSFIPHKETIQHPRIIIPRDVLVELPDGQAKVRMANSVAPDEKIVDIGPSSFGDVLPLLQRARSVLWNGPTGKYEDGYDDWSNAIADVLAENKGTSIVGGGDTIASITHKGIEEQVTLLSTAGGAMIIFLTEGTLPGIQVLEKSAQA